MYRFRIFFIALWLFAFTLQANCQALVSHLFMEDVRETVTFQQSGADVIGSFASTASGFNGNTVNIAIRPLWFHYDVIDKCGTTQLGDDITGLTTTTTYPSNFILSGVTQADLEGKSLVFQSMGTTACASIQQEQDYYITAAAYLRETIFGDIFFRQHSISGSTFINSDLKTSAAFSAASWFVAKNDVDCDNVGDPTQIEIFNPDNVNGGSCSQSAQANCAVGNLSDKVGLVQLADISSSNRAAYTDSNLPLSGDNSIADKFLIVYDPNNGNNVACTKINVFNQRTVVSTFSHGGITGSLVFKQRSPFDPTSIMAHLQGLNYMAGGYHVHIFPVPLQSEPNESICGGEVVSAHFNPFGVSLTNMYPAPTVATHDNYETGDLSSKHGTLEGLSELGPVNLTDWNLPLFGQNSIIGRSIVIHRNDSSASRWVCSNIELDGSIISASAVFTAPVIGHVYFTQTVYNPETIIFARLNYFDGRTPTTDHNWQISTYKVGRGMNCTSTGALYNPSGIWDGDSAYDMRCSSDTRLCKLGDLSGRHDTLTIGQAAVIDFTSKAFYTDSTVRLSGPNSVIGRSVVIMDGSSILSCATVQMLHDLKFSAQFDSGNFNGKVTFNQKAGFGQIPTSASVEELNGFNSGSHSLEIRSHPIASGNNPCADLGDVYDPLGVNVMSPATEDQYKVGDLSRRGSMEMWYDFNLPMKGPTSILGHSLAIINQNNVVACANIGFNFDGGIDGYMVSARLVFSGPMAGQIEISQIFYDDETLSDANIVVNLNSETGTTTTGHNWHVHVYPVSTNDTGPCGSAAGHYDPFAAQMGAAAVNYGTQCGLRAPLRCEVGDQANKVGTYDLGSGAIVYNDVYLPLEGEYSVQGRSIVVHEANRGPARVACADIIPINGVEVSASLQTPQNFDKTTAARVMATAINTEEENIVVELVSQNDEGVSNIRIHFLGKDRVMLRSNFLNFISSETNRQTLGDYSSITMSKASPVISTVVVLIISFIIGKLMSSA